MEGFLCIFPPRYLCIWICFIPHGLLTDRNGVLLCQEFPRNFRSFFLFLQFLWPVQVLSNFPSAISATRLSRLFSSLETYKGLLGYVVGCCKEKDAMKESFHLLCVYCCACLQPAFPGMIGCLLSLIASVISFPHCRKDEM